MNISVHNYTRIVILTGAGISADSGISTFRDSGGLWEKHHVEDVATPEAYARNPEFVWRFYSMRKLQAAMARPNSAHLALVNYAQNSKNQKIYLISQNVDVLHQRADELGALEMTCMHGSLNQSRCTHCQSVYFDDFAYFDLEGNYAPQETNLCSESEKSSVQYLHKYRLEYRHFLPLSPCCREPLRPHIVWFGEVPLGMDRAIPEIEKCDLFISIGTSGQVYPAAGFLQIAKMKGATTVCINKESIPHGQWIDYFIEGRAIDVVPEFFSLKY